MLFFQAYCIVLNNDFVAISVWAFHTKVFWSGKGLRFLDYGPFYLIDITTFAELKVYDYLYLYTTKWVIIIFQIKCLTVLFILDKWVIYSW